MSTSLTALERVQFKGVLEKIYSGAQTGRTARWVADVLDDKILFATPSVVCKYWPSAGMARDLPGLPTGEGWDGVTIFANRVILWRGQTIKSSQSDDFAQWIPVATTAVVGRATTARDVYQVDVGSTTEWLFLDDRAGDFSPGQFLRVVANEEDVSEIKYSYFTVAEAATFDSTATNAIGTTYEFLEGTEKKVFLSEDRTWPVGGLVKVNGEVTNLKVEEASRTISTESALKNGIAVVGNDTVLVPAVGDEVVVPLEQYPYDLQVGDHIYIGESSTVLGTEIYEVVVVGQNIRLKREGIGIDPQPVGKEITGVLYWQPWVKLKQYGVNEVNILNGTPVAALDALKLVNQGLTGGYLNGESIPRGSTVETIDENDAFEIENVGSDINGNVSSIIPLGEYAYIFKKRSIQSMQAVSRAAGTWRIRTEVLGEGPIGKYAAVRINDQTVVFWGHAEFYSYAGGKFPTAIATEASTLAFNELDRARADEIVAYHYVDKQEVHFFYPTIDGRNRAFIFNYHTGSGVYDDYPSHLAGVTAAGQVDWELAPVWSELDDSEIWTSDDKRWYEFVDVGERSYTMLGIDGDVANPSQGETAGSSVPRLLLSGRVYYRVSSEDCLPEGYTSLVETPDFDFGDPSLWKYVDTVRLSLHVEDITLDNPLKLNVQVGTRASLDDAIVWSDPTPVEITQSGSFPGTRANARGAGRLVRVRFYSDTPCAKWRISSYSVFARLGGTY